MGAEDLRKHVDERLEHIRKELVGIAEGIPEGPLQERISNLTLEIEKLVYETLLEVPQKSGEIKTGLTEFEDAGHRVNQASFGGLPELFADQPSHHKPTVSFGGIRQLFEVEMEVFGVHAESNKGSEDDDNRSASQSPIYDGVDQLFVDGPLQGKKNFSGVSDMFKKKGEEKRAGTPDNQEEKAKILGKEFDPTGRNHDRTVSIGGVGALTADQEDEMEDLFQSAEAQARRNDEKRPEGLSENQEEKNKNVGDELLPAPAHSHDRNVSIGGVRTVDSNQQDQEDEIEDLFRDLEVDKMSNEHETPGGPELTESHNRGASYGGARQLIDIECDSFSDEENSPKVPDNDQEKEPIVHKPDESGDALKELDKLREENNDLRAVNSRLESEIADLQKAVAVVVVKQDDGAADAVESEKATGGSPVAEKSNLEDEHNKHERCISHGVINCLGDGGSPVAEKFNLEDEHNKHERNVSHGGVRPLKDFDDIDLGLDELGDQVQGSNPRELFDGQGTVEDPRGHERRRSNLQDGRELFEDQDVEKDNSTYSQMRGDTFHEMDLSSTQKDGVMKELTREHLQLKMSKIELIKSTAEEIDRLRGIIKTLASQLKHIKEVHNKLLNTTLGDQMLGSVSGVFGAVTGFFYASEPAPV